MFQICIEIYIKNDNCLLKKNEQYLFNIKIGKKI